MHLADIIFLTKITSETILLWLYNLRMFWITKVDNPDDNDDIDQNKLDVVLYEIDKLVRDTIWVFAYGDESDKEMGDEDNDSFHDHDTDFVNGFRPVLDELRDTYDKAIPIV